MAEESFLNAEPAGNGMYKVSYRTKGGRGSAGVGNAEGSEVIDEDRLKMLLAHHKADPIFDKINVPKEINTLMQNKDFNLNALRGAKPVTQDNTIDQSAANRVEQYYKNRMQDIYQQRQDNPIRTKISDLYNNLTGYKGNVPGANEYVPKAAYDLNASMIQNTSGYAPQNQMYKTIAEQEFMKGTGQTALNQLTPQEEEQRKRLLYPTAIQ
jgi:hypothetical protein